MQRKTTKNLDTMKNTIIILLVISLFPIHSSAQRLILEQNSYSVIPCHYCSKAKNRFEWADQDKNGTIDISELRQFQAWLMNTYTYQSNLLALPPDNFMQEGGGDCEDFAAMTCCMLNSYGIIAYVATFGKVTVNKHAVCMVKVNKASHPGMLIYELWGHNAPNGYYLPVDYRKVGGLSAVDRRWKIASMDSPNLMFFKQL